MKAQSEVERIAQRYRRYGITLGTILGLIESGRRRGISEQAAVAGVRLALGSEFGEEEYFSAEQIAAMTGSTPQEAIAMMETHFSSSPEHGPVVSIDARAMDLLQGGAGHDV